MLLSNRDSLLTVLEAGKSKVRALAGFESGQDPLSGSEMAPHRVKRLKEPYRVSLKGGSSYS